QSKLERELDVIDRIANGERTIVQGVQRNSGWKLCLESRQHRLYSIHYLDDVGSWLLVDRKLDGTHALRGVCVVIPTRVVRVFNAVDDSPEVREPDRRAVAICHNQIRVIRCLVELSRCLQCDCALRSPQYACRYVDVPVIERCIDIVDT